MKILMCGCCGMSFQTWEGYEDQDQDKDYGICKECQNDALEKNNDLLDDAISQIKESLKPENKKKFKALSLLRQRGVAYKLIENGAFSWSIS